MIEEKLPSRTAKAIRARALVLDCRVRRAIRYSSHEDEVVRKHYPDYTKIHRLLKHRDLGSIKNRAKYLGILKPRRRWTIAELKAIARADARKASNDELLAIAPGASLTQIKSRLQNYRQTMDGRQPPAAINNPTLQSIRQRAFQVGVSLAKLDHIARSGRYFSRGIETLNVEYVRRAVEFLGGELHVEWR